MSAHEYGGLTALAVIGPGFVPVRCHGVDDITWLAGIVGAMQHFIDDDGGYLDWLAANPEGLSSTPPAIRHRRTSYCIVPVGLLAGSERVVIAGPLTMLSTATNVPNWKRSGKVTATTCLAPAPCLADGSLPHTTPDRRGGAPASATGETELRVVAQVTGVMILHAR